MTVIGVGSPFGDDRLGWRVIEALEGRIPPSRARMRKLDRPGPSVLDELAGRGEAVLVDGAVTGDVPGTIHRYSAEQVLSPATTTSSHELGLAEALALGKALGILPPRLTLYLVSLDPVETAEPDAALTPPVEDAARAVADEIQRRLAE